jgi:hypothetical protein
MDEKPKLLVDMLGVRFSLQADEDVVYLQSLVSCFEADVKDALSYAKPVGSGEKIKPEIALKTAILAGILTADKFYKEKKKSYLLAQKVLELEAALSLKLESSLVEGNLSASKSEKGILLPEPTLKTENSHLVQSLMDELEAVLEES